MVRAEGKRRRESGIYEQPLLLKAGDTQTKKGSDPHIAQEKR